MAKKKLTEKDRLANVIYAIHSMTFFCAEKDSKEELLDKILTFSCWLQNFTKSPIN